MYTVKAIVIGEKGAYKHLNGKTFPVKLKSFWADLAHNRVVLQIPDGTEPDFAFPNVLLVDVEAIAQYIYDTKNWAGNSGLYGNPQDAYNGLERYAKIHDLKLSPVYNCPA